MRTCMLLCSCRGHLLEHNTNRGPRKFSFCLNSRCMREKRKDGKAKTQLRERTPCQDGGSFLTTVFPFPSSLFSLIVLEFKQKLNFLGPLLQATVIKKDRNLRLDPDRSKPGSNLYLFWRIFEYICQVDGQDQEEDDYYGQAGPHQDEPVAGVAATAPAEGVAVPPVGIFRY